MHTFVQCPSGGKEMLSSDLKDLKRARKLPHAPAFINGEILPLELETTPTRWRIGGSSFIFVNQS